MLFNSLDFAIFLPIVFALYWSVFRNRLKAQNAYLVLVSYIFYGWWDWRFLSLIAFSSSVDFLVGIGLGRREDRRSRNLLLLTSIVTNLGLLGFFKYFNFFADSFANAFSLFGTKLDVARLSIVLPVGISFYTFQTLSYSIDVYRRKLEPTRDPVAFFAFVSFFPQLVAGPIERATNLLPQFFQNREFDYSKAVDGLRQILWGLFKKMVVADNCATIVNAVYASPSEYSGSTLALATLFFAFQIYGDFSGYSDIAIGTARLFGFDLMRNFAFPYFSRDIAEFWRRWHISLSTWFRDYLYIPLGGSKAGTTYALRNILIIFVVSGFWHGANWTFIVWGFLNALYFLPLFLMSRNRENLDIASVGRIVPGLPDVMKISVTFILTCIAWVFFRSASVSQAFGILSTVFSASIMQIPQVYSLKTLSFISLMLVFEWLQRDRLHALDLSNRNIPGWLRWGVYYFLIWLVLFFGGEQKQFIYFQF